MKEQSVERLNALIRMGTEIGTVRDLELTLEMVLATAREFTRCDAGTIYIRHGTMLEFACAQNDTLQHLEPDKRLFTKGFTLPIDSNSIAGHVALTGEQVNTPNAYAIERDKKPFSFNASYDRSSCYLTRSLLTVPLKTSAGDVIGVLQLINALDGEERIVPFDTAVEPYVVYAATTAANALERALLTRTIILRMVRMTELRDPRETGAHVSRVAGYAVEIYRSWAASERIVTAEMTRTTDVLYQAAMLHDVGKAAISDFILKKPGKLTPEEYDVIKNHAVTGAVLLSGPATDLEKAAQIVALNHHERWDGKGYPGHVDPDTGAPLTGKTDATGKPTPKHEDEIPLMGRIVAVADVYDALSFPRVYKDAWEQERVLSYIWEERGGQFDPAVVDAFFDCLIRIREVAERHGE